MKKNVDDSPITFHSPEYNKKICLFKANEDKKFLKRLVEIDGSKILGYFLDGTEIPKLPCGIIIKINYQIKNLIYSRYFRIKSICYGYGVVSPLYKNRFENVSSLFVEETSPPINIKDGNITSSFVYGEPQERDD